MQTNIFTRNYDVIVKAVRVCVANTVSRGKNVKK